MNKNNIKLFEQSLEFDYVIAGGGLSGICCAITAARGGLKVALINDRPVLGGNASSEVCVWVNGAGSHMGNNNRWAREGGVIDEIISDNLYKNKEGNAVIFDTIMLDKVLAEENISLFLNTAVNDVEMKDDSTVKSIKAFNSNNETIYHFSAPIFCDATGDGIVSYLAGAQYHDKAELLSMFDEKFKPYENFGEMLGHSILFYSKNVGEPVEFIPPNFALKDITKIPKYKIIKSNEHGCSLWWIEWGAHLDTIHDSEKIKFELWKIVYGIWDYIKNSGNFPEAKNLTLEWVGSIPGKRESRRFLSDSMLIQQDIIEQRLKEDAVAHGGWALDLHPADGIYTEKDSCVQVHSKGIYQIPYSIMYSKNINNLFITGRLASVSHIAFSSTRVMLTCAVMGQAVGAAAVLCKRFSTLPREIGSKDHISVLQQYLLRDGQFIPYIPSIDNKVNKCLSANIEVSSTYKPTHFSGNGNFMCLKESMALLTPILDTTLPIVEFSYSTTKDTSINVFLMKSKKPENYTPKITIESQVLSLKNGKNIGSVEFKSNIESGFIFIVFEKNENVSLEVSDNILSSVVTVFNTFNNKVAKSMQLDTQNLGIENFDFWIPKNEFRLQNIALQFSKPLNIYHKSFIQNGYHRPFLQSNCWVADINDNNPYIDIKWDSEQTLKVLLLFFDGEYDFSPLNIQYKYEDNTRKYCVKSFKVYDDNGNMLSSIENNYQARVKITLGEIKTKSIKIVFKNQRTPISVFGVQCI